jgi:hypothetical protein
LEKHEWEMAWNDAGKITIPAEIRSKPGKLTPIEEQRGVRSTFP